MKLRLYYTQQVLEREAQHTRLGARGEEQPWSRLCQASGEPRGREDHGHVPFIGVRVESASRRCEGTSLMRLNVTRSLSGEGKKGNLWQGPALSP